MRTFSESWHRVANLTLALRPSVVVRRQRFRGEDWYVLGDTFNSRYFRLRPAAYAFVSRLSTHRTVEDVWRQCLDLDPEDAPGQEEVVQLLTQLHLSDLLFFTNMPDTDLIFERGSRRRERELRGRLMNIMFIRIPLFNPTRLLDRLRPITRHLISPLSFLVWLIVISLGIKAAADHADQLLHPGEGILAPGNLPLLYVALVAVMAVHEACHAVMCRHFGGEVHTIGLTLSVFTPLPYVDASSAWAITDRHARALVGAAGMLGEGMVAALAALVWAKVGDGPVHAIAYNVMVAASVSTLVFNINPLIRFDGYYILSDLLDIPNLYMRSRDQVLYLANRWLLGDHLAESPADNRSEEIWLSLFGLGSGAYRTLVFAGIVLVVSDQFLMLGLLVGLVGLVTMVVTPLVRMVMSLRQTTRAAGNRLRATAVIGGGSLTLLLLMAVVPLPYGVTANGVVEALPYTEVFSGAPGWIDSLPVTSGKPVAEGDVLVVMSNPDLETEMVVAQAQYRETEAALDRARSDAIADLDPMTNRLQSLTNHINDLQQQLDALTVTARQAGIWVAPHQAERKGGWVDRGAPLGQVVSTEGYRFSAVVTQEETADLFDIPPSGGVVRLRGEADMDIPVANINIIPYEQRKLPSATLGWAGGGGIATSRDDNEGRTSREPFFQIFATLDAKSLPGVMHGRSGMLRLSMPGRTVLWRISHGFGQMLQKRYRL